ncbi:MAG TPA: DCC1-like thiol-disulfide oxidoreductase family protein [Pyrinomonadaceae bacterium]|nr:DCC1-like thiol-disulfide oxidoreductase family protein [Pyrinomonadaceae bacterium]
MTSLTVLYDPDCGLCRRVHQWLDEQSQLVELKLIPIKSDEARQRFPHLDHEVTSKDLTVIGDQGDVYFGPKAWLMVLWALVGYREWSYRLAAPELLPTVRRVVSLISQHRYQIGRVSVFRGE